ncbi:helicase-related protein [Vibrio sp. 10N.222.46.A1]|uniref:helicase-related protein n=1 Tax=Vibrio sp. 10N.222.46.A1 TaxID=3229599 RepID=UPI003550A49C
MLDSKSTNDDTSDYSVPLSQDDELNESQEVLAELLLQSPIKIHDPLPQIVERRDIFSHRLETRVYVEMIAEKNHGVIIRPTSNEKVCYLTADLYLAYSQKKTKLAVATFSDLKNLQNSILMSAKVRNVISLNGVLTLYGDVYQLKDVRINPIPKNGMWREYGAYSGIKSTHIPKLVIDAIQNKKIGKAAVSKLFAHLRVSNLEEYKSLIRKLNIEPKYDNPQKLIIDTHIGLDHSCVRAKQALEVLATSTIVQNYKGDDSQYAIEPVSVCLEHFADGVKSLHFQPTKEQIKIALNILASYQRDLTTKSLIYGDVGFGKTAVIALVIYHVITSGRDCVLLSPTEHLAFQTHKVMTSWFNNIQESFRLVTHSTDVRLMANAEDSTIGRCYIGTSALLFRDDVTFKPYLIAVDEEQRMGISQRDHFQKQGAHYIALTATPIPRTVAQTLMSHYKTYNLTNCFVEKSFSGELVMEEMGRQHTFKMIKQAIINKTQTLIVCPLTTDSDAMEGFKSVDNLYESLSEYFGVDKLRYVHSKRTPEENAESLRAIANGEADILVATTVIEVGIDLPLLKNLIVWHPERFGLTQLHQLRGRIVRQGGHGHVTMYSPTHLNSEQIQRLKYFAKTTDGSLIAEFDAKRRGVGDIIGKTSAQSGQSLPTWIRHLTVDFEALSDLKNTLSIK